MRVVPVRNMVTIIIVVILVDVVEYLLGYHERAIADLLHALLIGWFISIMALFFSKNVNKEDLK